MSIATVSVAQFAPTADLASNLAAMESLAESSVRRGASLVVFPEYSSYFSVPLGPEWVAAAQPLDGEFVSRLSTLASRLGIHIVAGMAESADDSARFFNTLVAVTPAGAIASEYRKLHLYDAFGEKESQFTIPGPIVEPVTFGWEGFTVGLQTCYDLRFPEVTRRLVDAGADLVVVPSEWVRGPLKEHHWRTLVTARALENTIYVAAADHAPPVGAGNSMVVDPFGVELATIGDETGVAVAEISLDRVKSVRAINPSLALRRFGVTEL